MKSLLTAALVLACAGVNAQTYRCPNTYPTKGMPHIPLSNAAIYLGERYGKSAVHGDIEVLKDGTDIHYSLPDDIPRWLVCQYGGKRIDGTDIRAAQVVGSRDWWIPLDPSIEVCDLKIRLAKLDKDIGPRTATTICKGKALPPPVMLD